MSDIFGVYKIENKINNRVYIGYSSNITNRFHRHFKKLEKGVHWNKSLQTDWNIYGAEIFNFSIEHVVDFKGKIEESELVDIGIYLDGVYMDKYANKYNILPKHNTITPTNSKLDLTFRMENTLNLFNSKKYIVEFQSNNLTIVRVRRKKLISELKEKTKAKKQVECLALSYALKECNIKNTHNDIILNLEINNIIDNFKNVLKYNDILYKYVYNEENPNSYGLRVYKNKLKEFSDLIESITNTV